MAQDGTYSEPTKQAIPVENAAPQDAAKSVNKRATRGEDWHKIDTAPKAFGPVDLAAFWSLPIAPVALLADVLNTSPQGVGRMGFPTYRIGNSLYVKPIEVAHNFRALKPEVSK